MGIWLIFLFLKAVVNIPIQTLLIRHDCYFVRWSSLSWSLGCLWSNRKKPKTASDIKSENPSLFFAKTENLMLKNGKSANRNEHQNRKTEVYWHRNRKTNLKIAKTAKPKIPMPPSVVDKGKLRSIMKQIWIRSLLFYQPRWPLSYSTQWILIFYCYRLKEIYRVEEWECLNPTNSLQLLLSLVSCSSLMYQNMLISQIATYLYHFSRFQVNFFWFSFPLCLLACKSLWQLW